MTRCGRRVLCEKVEDGINLKYFEILKRLTGFESFDVCITIRSDF